MYGLGSKGVWTVDDLTEQVDVLTHGAMESFFLRLPYGLVLGSCKGLPLPPGS